MHFGKTYIQICALFPDTNDTVFQRHKEKYVRVTTTRFNTFSGSAFNVCTKQYHCLSLKINIIVETALEIIL